MRGVCLFAACVAGWAQEPSPSPTPPTPTPTPFPFDIDNWHEVIPGKALCMQFNDCFCESSQCTCDGASFNQEQAVDAGFKRGTCKDAGYAWCTGVITTSFGAQADLYDVDDGSRVQLYRIDLANAECGEAVVEAELADDIMKYGGFERPQHNDKNRACNHESYSHDSRTQNETVTIPTGPTQVSVHYFKADCGYPPFTGSCWGEQHDAMCKGLCEDNGGNWKMEADLHELFCECESPELAI